MSNLDYLFKSVVALQGEPFLNRKCSAKKLKINEFL